MLPFGELIAELRLDKRMTQRELSDVLHVSVGTISNYENQVHLPDVEKLIELANFFNVSTDYLLGRAQTSLSPDAFNEEIAPGLKAGKFLESMKRLSPARRSALCLILHDMEFCEIAEQYGKQGSQ